ncbi:MAG: Transposase DDE domain protein [Anaerolineales bacterium]|nr:Transposase DDE domain protein [Anaerolineales bacterium]
MKKSSIPDGNSTHQTVTGFINLSTPKETIQIGFTDQKVSGHAGIATFCGFLHWHRFQDQLAGWLPHRRVSPKAIPPADVALGFIAGILAGAQKLAHVAGLRRDVMLAPLLAIRRIASQSTFTRFFQDFKTAGANLAAFRPFWRWAMRRLPSRRNGYSLDLDSTRLLHEDGHQEGVAVGYTRLGNKPCLHPLLAVLEEAKLVVGFWLRPGNSSCANNVVAFTQELVANLPRHLRVRVVRADSGFCVAAWLELLEALGWRYIVVARLLAPLQRLVKKETIWMATEVAGTEVGDLWHQEHGWAKPRRLILIRHRLAEKKRPGGKRLVDCPGYAFQALVTDLSASVPPIAVWRDYNGRAGAEGVIKQLDMDFALPKLCLEKFWSTEAALTLAVMSYNLCVLFQRHVGWLERVTAATLRERLWKVGGILSGTGGRTTIRLSVPEGQRGWWRAVLEKIQWAVPNCNAVEPRPA